MKLTKNICCFLSTFFIQGEYGTISDLEKLQILRPNIRIEGSWKESVPLNYNLPVNIWPAY